MDADAGDLAAQRGNLAPLSLPALPLAPGTTDGPDRSPLDPFTYTKVFFGYVIVVQKAKRCDSECMRFNSISNSDPSRFSVNQKPIPLQSSSFLYGSVTG